MFDLILKFGHWAKDLSHFHCRMPIWQNTFQCTGWFFIYEKIRPWSLDCNTCYLKKVQISWNTEYFSPYFKTSTISDSIITLIPIPATFGLILYDDLLIFLEVSDIFLQLSWLKYHRGLQRHDSKDAQLLWAQCSWPESKMILPSLADFLPLLRTLVLFLKPNWQFNAPIILFYRFLKVLYLACFWGIY